MKITDGCIGAGKQKVIDFPAIGRFDDSFDVDLFNYYRFPVDRVIMKRHRFYIVQNHRTEQEPISTIKTCFGLRRCT